MVELLLGLSQYPIRPLASWAIDSEPIRARGIIVNYSADCENSFSISRVAKRAGLETPSTSERANSRAVTNISIFQVYTTSITSNAFLYFLFLSIVGEVPGSQPFMTFLHQQSKEEADRGFPFVNSISAHVICLRAEQS